MTAQLQADRQTNMILTANIFWRAVFALIAILGVFGISRGDFPGISTWPGWILMAVLIIAGIFSGLAAVLIIQRDHRARIISLVLDYLAFVFFAVLLLNIGEVFTGLDAFGETFGRGIPYLGIVLAGYLLGSLEDYFPNEKKTSETSLKITSRYVMMAGLILFLWQVGTLDGILFFIRKLSQPAGLLSIAGVTIFGIALWSMGRERTAEALHAKAHHEQILNGWLFLSPNLLGFLVFFAGPLILSFYFSFTDSDAFNTPNWVGFANYAKILSVRFALLSSPDQLAREVVDITKYDEVGRFIF
jgi:hypothetical protein